jgi:phosphomevalonate kinase
VATLAARDVGDVDDPAGRERIFRAALRAHKHVQPGGSGVDVVTSTFGGVVACRVDAGEPSFTVHRFPAPVRVFASRTPASTKDMVAAVRAFEQGSPREHERIIAAAREAAADVALATTEADLLDAMRAQDRALRELGRAARVPIFTPDVDALAEIAAREGAFFGPSGAGGGDIAIRVGSAPSTEAFATALVAVGVDPLDVATGAQGVSRVGPER